MVSLSINRSGFQKVDKSAPVRIALYTPSLGAGGAESVIVTLANGFSERGIVVDLVTATAEGHFRKDLSDAVRIVDLESPRVLFSLAGLIRYLRRERPEAMLSVLNYANVIATIAWRWARVPTRLVVSERTTLSKSKSSMRNIRGRFVPALVRWAYPRASAVTAVSSGVADDLVEHVGLSRERIQVVYNPIVSPELCDKSRRPLSHPWLRKDAPPVILGVGRLTTAKDYPTLIRAFAQLRKQRPARLIILGEGELRGELETLVADLRIGDDVALPGFSDNPFAWMSRASLYVLSSSWEGLPGSLIQAMACGTPVVSTDCPSGPAEILENGKWGRLVAVGDSEALASAMSATLDEKEHPKVSARADFFSIERAVDGYLKVLTPGLV